jgi:uncharacterized protein (TIGR00255 family)
MTGYGQGASEAAGLRLTVQLRSVNNRFTDLRFRIPGELGVAEAELRRKILARVRRGRVELTVRIERSDGADAQPTLNRALLAEVLQASRALREDYGVGGDLEQRDVVGIPGLFRADATEVEWGETELTALHRALDEGLRSLDEDRVREGGVLQRDLLERIARMKTLATNCRRRAEKMPARVRDRLIERLRALSPDLELDPSRAAQEAAVLADRADVTEEMVRLEGHLDQAESLLAGTDDKPLGKRLDFLAQEIQRETNTLGNKSVDLELTRAAMELKVEVEKVREQVQNLE